jgi:hypothetical protein
MPREAVPEPVFLPGAGLCAVQGSLSVMRSPRFDDAALVDAQALGLSTTPQVAEAQE